MRRPNLTQTSRFVAPHLPLAEQLAATDSPTVAASAEIIEYDNESASLLVRDPNGNSFQQITLQSAGSGSLRLTISPLEKSAPRHEKATKLITATPRSDSKVTVTQDTVGMTTPLGGISIDLRTMLIQIMDSEGRTLTTTPIYDLDATGNYQSLPLGTTMSEQVTVHHLSLLANADDAYFGLGESFTPLNKRGQHLSMWTSDTYGTGTTGMYKPVPYVYSTSGYALLVNSAAPVEFDLASSSQGALSVLCPDDVLDLFILFGKEPADALVYLHELTGPLVMPPRWAFGGWVSTGFLPQTQESVMAQAVKVREHGLPCDVIHIDPYWMKPGMWCDLLWDEKTFPDPAAMFTKLREMNLRVCLWINPYISEESPVFDEGAAHGYFMKTAAGTPWLGQIWGDDVPHPQVAVVDFTNPEACTWYAAMLRGVLKLGAAVFKTDFGEALPPGSFTHDGISGADIHNVYPLLYNDVVADVTEEVTGDRLVWARSSFIGGHRHVAQWGGDTRATWQGMASTLRGALSYSMSGYSFWSHDVGGFSGKPTPELFRAWAQWGAFSPLFRLHGTSSRIPWEWDAKTEEDVIAAVRLRYEYLPYIMSESKIATALNRPIAQPAALFADANIGSENCDSAFMLGTSLLVMPQRDLNGKQRAFVPEGEWIDFNTGKVVVGPQWLSRKITGPVPMLVKAGSLLVTSPGLTSMPEGPFTNVTLQLWKPNHGEIIHHDLNKTTRITVTMNEGVPEITTEGPLLVSQVTVVGADCAKILFNGQEHKLLTIDSMRKTADLNDSVAL